MSSLNIVQSSLASQRKTPPKESETPSPSSFEFVTFSDLGSMRNASAKSQIRKHAMKDIGVMRRRPNRRRRGYVNVPVEFVPDALTPHPASTGISYEGVDPFLQYPVELDADKRKLVANMFGRAQSALRDDWFTVALMSAPAFNQALANSAIQFESLDVSSIFDRSAMQYHLLALSSLRTELAASKGKATEGVLAAVSALVCWNAIRETSEEWGVQVQGMLGLINSYDGGLEAITRNQSLRSTLSWVELRGAYMQDLAAQIPVPETWVAESDNLRFNGPYFDCNGRMGLFSREHWANYFPSPTTILRIFEDLVYFSQYTANDVANSSIDYETLKLPLWTNVIIFRLLALRPLEGLASGTVRSADLVAEAFRLAMLLYIAPVWRFYGAHPSQTRTILYKLRGTLESPLKRALWCPPLRRLQAWVLCMGAMEAEFSGQNEIKESFRCMLANFASMDGNTDILESARSILWIHGLFDNQAAVLQTILLINPPSGSV